MNSKNRSHSLVVSAIASNADDFSSKSKRATNNSIVLADSQLRQRQNLIGQKPLSHYKGKGKKNNR